MEAICDKIAFNHRHEAIKYSRLMMAKKTNLKKGVLRPYDCPHCGKIHLTSQSYNPRRGHRDNRK